MVYWWMYLYRLIDKRNCIMIHRNIIMWMNLKYIYLYHQSTRNRGRNRCITPVEMKSGTWNLNNTWPLSAVAPGEVVLSLAIVATVVVGISDPCQQKSWLSISSSSSADLVDERCVVDSSGWTGNVVENSRSISSSKSLPVRWIRISSKWYVIVVSRYLGSMSRNNSRCLCSSTRGGPVAIDYHQ